MITDQNRKDRKEEIKGIIELLQSCLQEEGYEIPKAQYADGNWNGFDIPLHNAIYEKDNLFIKIEWH